MTTADETYVEEESPDVTAAFERLEALYDELEKNDVGAPGGNPAAFDAAIDQLDGAMRQLVRAAALNLWSLGDRTTAFLDFVDWLDAHRDWGAE